MRIEPTDEVFLHSGPFLVQEGEPGGVAVAAFDDHSLAEGAFVGEAEAEGGVAGRLVEGVAFPFEAAITKFVKYAAHQQEDGFGGGWSLFEGRAEMDVADFDDAVGLVDAHEACEADRVVGPCIDDGVKQRVGFCGDAGEPGLEGIGIGERSIR